MPERKQTILPNREWKPLQKSSMQHDSYLNARITITPWVHFLPQNTNRAELVLSVIVDLCQNTKINTKKRNVKISIILFTKAAST